MCDNFIKFKEQALNGIIMTLKETVKQFDTKVYQVMALSDVKQSKYSDTYSRIVTVDNKYEETTSALKNPKRAEEMVDPFKVSNELCELFLSGGDDNLDALYEASTLST